MPVTEQSTIGEKAGALADKAEELKSESAKVLTTIIPLEVGYQYRIQIITVANVDQSFTFETYQEAMDLLNSL